MTTKGAIFLALSGLLALPAAAAPLWEQRFDAGFAESGAVIEVDAAGDILVAANGSNDYLLTKYDADGNQLWLKWCQVFTFTHSPARPAKTSQCDT